LQAKAAPQGTNLAAPVGLDLRDLISQGLAARLLFIAGAPWGWLRWAWKPRPYFFFLTVLVSLGSERRFAGSLAGELFGESDRRFAKAVM